MLKDKLTGILIFLLILSSCVEKENNTINDLKQKYSAEVINYFYKVAFHSDADSKVYPISKWDKDIYWYIEIDTLPGDRSAVLEAMNELNALELPISFYEVLNKDSANFHILFGSYEELGLPGGFEGTASNLVKDGNILNGAVKIPHDSSNLRTVSAVSRKKRIFEEVIQCLGLPGDSFDYPGSLFYQGINYVNIFPELDKQLLRLLYEPAITPAYRVNQFEKDFGEVLYHVNGKQKFRAFLEENHFTKDPVKKILDLGLTENLSTSEEEVMKFGTPVNVFVNGDVYPEFVDILRKAIAELNKVSENLKLVFVSKGTLTHREGVYFNFVKDPTFEKVAVHIGPSDALKVKGLAFPLRRSRESFEIVFSDREGLTNTMQEIIPNMLYRSLGIYLKNPEAYSFQNGNFQIKPEYRDILMIYYDKSLPNGFTRKELEEVITQLKNSRVNHGSR